MLTNIRNNITIKKSLFGKSSFCLKNIYIDYFLQSELAKLLLSTYLIKLKSEEMKVN